MVKPGFRTPTWIKNRRRFLKKLSPAACNLVLTGDPFFAFDNVAYESAWVPRLPPAAAANQVPHPAVVDPPPDLAPVVPPLAGHVTPPTPPPVPQPRYPLLAQFCLLQFETPPRHLFDCSPPRSPDPPHADPPNAGPPPCLPSRPSSSGASLSPTPPPPWAHQSTSTDFKTRQSGPQHQLELKDHPPPPLGSPPREATSPPCQPSPRRSRRSRGRNVRTVQHPSQPQPPMTSSSYQVIRTQFTLYLMPKTFIATVTLLTLLAHPNV